MRWALIDGTNTIVNIIEWDGVTKYKPADGLTLLRVNSKAMIGALVDDSVTEEEA